MCAKKKKADEDASQEVPELTEEYLAAHCEDCGGELECNESYVCYECEDEWLKNNEED
jgi:DNA-directed RNA polymerase subunit RPC12/RpoP